jgi:hypothetical protein
VYTCRETKPKVPKIDAFLSAGRTCNVDRATKLNDKIAMMIVKDLRPISFVAGSGFKDLMAFCEPGYNMPGRTFFTAKLEKMQAELKESLKATLALTKFVALTSDIWTSAANESYISVTVHYIDNSWVLCDRVLAVMPIDERHTGDNIVKWLLDALAQYDLSPSKVSALVHDNGSNMVAAAKKLEALHGWSSVRCVAHTIQLVVNAVLQSVSISDTLTSARRVVEHFKRSALATSMLHAKQEQMSVPDHQMIMDVSTRWNSTLYMIDRLLEQRWPVSAVLSDKGHKSCQNLSEIKWEMLSTVKSMLEPFEAATVFISGEKYVTASAVVSVIHALRAKMEPAPGDVAYVKQLKEIALTQLADRWQLEVDQVTGDNRKLFSVALKSVVLDPRFKFNCLSPQTARYVRSELAAEAIKYGTTTEVVDLPPVDNEVCVTASERPSTSSDHDYSGTAVASTSREQAMAAAIDNLFGGDDVMSPDPVPGDDAVSSVDDQIGSLFREARLSRQQCPLQWWKSNSPRYNLLVPLALKYLCIPGSSTPSERTFSVAGLTLSRLRSALSPEHVDMLVVMHANSDLLE